MRCSNCDAEVKEGSRYCGSCGTNFLLTTSAWLLRRTVAGAIAGCVGWFLSSVIFNIIASDIGEPSYVIIRTIVSAVFIGVVIGVLEKSTRKIIFGLIGGIIGGVLGGLIATFILKNDVPMWLFVPEKAKNLEFSLYTTANAVIWLIVGAFIGFFTSQKKRGISAFIGGALGGAIGGAVGWEIFLRLRYESTSAIMFTVADMLYGGITSGLIFLFIGMSERFSPVTEGMNLDESMMICVICRKETPVSGYCINCGNILKAPKVVNPRRYGALHRISNVFRFLGRFILIIGLIMATSYFVVLLPKSIFLSSLGLIGISAVSYMIFVTFNAIAETILVFLDIENNTRKLSEK
ncbi:MAG: zinc ribbon domain-containing protein [Elusimicrobia bacterium]|nr:zinc ribbon domain-containing protein [Elusimicrobiota bacterium]